MYEGLEDTPLFHALLDHNTPEIFQITLVAQRRLIVLTLVLSVVVGQRELFGIFQACVYSPSPQGRFRAFSLSSLILNSYSLWWAQIRKDVAVAGAVTRAHKGRVAGATPTPTGDPFVDGRGSSSVPPQQQPATPAGGREAIPKLVYGVNSNYPKWLEKITAYAVQTYNADGMFFHTGGLHRVSSCADRRRIWTKRPRVRQRPGRHFERYDSKGKCHRIAKPKYGGAFSGIFLIIVLTWKAMAVSYVRHFCLRWSGCEILATLLSKSTSLHQSME